MMVASRIVLASALVTSRPVEKSDAHRKSPFIGARKDCKFHDRFRESHIGQFAVRGFGEHGSTSSITAAATGTTANGSGQRGEITSTGRVRCSPTSQKPVFYEQIACSQGLFLFFPSLPCCFCCGLNARHMLFSTGFLFAL
jgi:hypothetical protein